MQIIGDKLLFSPHDLVGFLEGPFVSWMERFLLIRGGLDPKYQNPWPGIPDDALARDKGSAEMEMIAKRGIAHEKAYVGKLKNAEPNLADLTGSKDPQALVTAMKEGHATIYQGCLRVDPLLGYPDFLQRETGVSKLGDWYYEPHDTKLALSAKPAFIIQLLAYCDMLESIQGRRPKRFAFLLGNQTQECFPTDDFFFYYQNLRAAFLEFQQQFDPRKPPDPGLDRSHGRWSELAAAILEQRDHLSRVARITFPQMQKLETAQIKTLTALAQTYVQVVPRMQPETFARLRLQANLQLTSQGLDKPKFIVLRPEGSDPRRGLALLPPSSDQDVYFDMEGFPLAVGGLEYLFGVVCLEDGVPLFKDWWAHDNIQEQKAFEQFIDWIHSRWQQDKTMHIYHYAAYEPSAMRRLMGKYGSREREVDDLLRNGVFVDLYTVVRQGVAIGTPGYSLKDIECLFMSPRAGEVVSASGSVVAYQHWLDSGEPQQWETSPLLKEIRDYNEVDCQSTWKLCNWLRHLQEQASIPFIPRDAIPEQDETAPVAERASTTLMRQMTDEITNDKVKNTDRKRIQELLAWLLEFHWREAKPIWWRMFDRAEMTEQELYDDLDCLAGLERTMTSPSQLGSYVYYEYRYDADQDSKLHVDSKCYFAHDLKQRTEIAEFDPEAGRVVIKVSQRNPSPPKHLNLIPNEYVNPEVIADAVFRFVTAWHSENTLSQAVDDLLERRAPRIVGYTTGPIIDPNGDLVPQLANVVERMDRTTLCIQGPPGTGKTYAIGKVAAQLLKQGKRIGVTANSHKAIMNVLQSIHESCLAEGTAVQIIKVGGDKDDPLIKAGQVTQISSAKILDALVRSNAVVVGGTAWAFSREELQQKFDYLFIDEAGQFSLANVVGVGLCAQNLILVGDQNQLSQPMQGTHPGETGQSGLDYLLDGQATIPPDFGVFLDVTWRMHPDVCRFISDAVYEGRLTHHPKTEQRRILPPKSATYVQRQTGVLYVPVTHTGNTQCSEEEVDRIEAIVGELLKGQIEDEGKMRSLTLQDILFVAPYNMQVRRLGQRLGKDARVGSVDKFQGLEAPVVIVSMCASTLEDSPRGAEFLLNRNRLNVAISRARCLSIVVGSPAIMTARCQTIDQMQLVNLYCRIVDYSQKLGSQE